MQLSGAYLWNASSPIVRLGGIAVSRFLGKEEVAGSIPARGFDFIVCL